MKICHCPSQKRMAMTISTVLSCYSACAEKVGMFCGWTGLAWAKLLVHIKSVSAGLVLLVLLQIGAKETTVYSSLLQ